MKRFIALYILYLAIAFLVVDYEPMRRFLHLEDIYNSFVTKISALFIELINIPVTSSANTLHLPHANMIIKFGCNGLEAILIYLAGVLAYPASWRARLLWGFVGVLFLELINFARIALLAWVIEHYPKHFNLMHDYITQSVMIALAFLLFLLYLQKVGDAKGYPQTF